MLYYSHVEWMFVFPNGMASPVGFVPSWAIFAEGLNWFWKCDLMFGALKMVSSHDKLIGSLTPVDIAAPQQFAGLTSMNPLSKKWRTSSHIFIPNHSDS
jgi:hypothetical protein